MISKHFHLVRIGGIICGILIIVFGLHVFFEVSYIGFPHVSEMTEYEITVKPAFTMIAYASFVGGLYFFLLAIFAKHARTYRRFFIAIIFCLVFLVGLRYGFESYIKNFTDINYGQGG